ncbi:MFS transporter [Leuconostoc falkenbergense]|uniref:MFS transporter n=1 Tax=Leuconostoc falkenbergense TaxID=2766470 RepID=UPI0024AE1B1A|nr:MFS transporter [Leuconostoc falkenbergense]MDI6666726.1 MFS transporter [Leuconostoc falkenbergense]
MTIPLKRNYLSLALSPFASQIGSAIYVLGLNWLIVKSTGTTAELGIIEGVGGFAFLLGDLLVGLLVDRNNRKHVLIYTDFISVITCIVSSVFINNQQPQFWMLTAITFILNFMLALNYPASKALAPEIIGNQHLQKFNAISNTLFSLANIFAPLIGGLLLAVKAIHFNEFILINAFSFAIALILNLLISYQPSNMESNAESESVIKSTIAGLKYVHQHKSLLRYMLSMGFFNFVYAGFLLTIPYVAKHDFASFTSSYSIFLTVTAVGGLTGGFFLTIQSNQMNSTYIFAEQIVYGLILIICSVAFSLYTWFVIALIHGLVQARFFSCLTTFIQAETSLAYLGRIFGLTFLFFDGIQPIGSFAFGFFISEWGHFSYLILGLITLSLFTPMYFLENHSK